MEGASTASKDDFEPSFAPRSGELGVGSASIKLSNSSLETERLVPPAESARPGAKAVAADERISKRKGSATSEISNLDERIAQKQKKSGGKVKKEKSDKAMKKKTGKDSKAVGAEMVNSIDDKIARKRGDRVANGDGYENVPVTSQSTSDEKVALKINSEVPDEPGAMFVDQSTSLTQIFGKKQGFFGGFSKKNIVMEDLDDDIKAANPDLIYTETKKGFCTPKVFVLTCVGIIVVVVIAVGTGIAVSNKNKEEEKRARENAPPTMAPTSTNYFPIQDTLSEVFDPVALSTKGTPQQQALNWIANEDTMALTAQSPNLVQRYVLMVLYYNNNGPSWVSKDNWQSSVSECDWEYNRCEEIDGYQKITNLDVTNNQLSGELPHEIMHLDSLVSLNVEENDLVGTLPNFIYNMTSLEYVNLGGNNFNGTIHEDIGNLVKLEYLDLSSNDLSGELPSTFKNLVNMRDLILYSNHFKGLLLDKVDVMTNLETLDVGNNDFSGSIIPSIGSLQKLTTLNAEHNEFNGTLPAEIGNCSSLVTLTLMYNKFEGDIPATLGQLNNMRFLDMESNKFDSKIPTEFGELDHLEILNIGNCALSGTLPTEIGKMAKLNSLALFSNNINGTVPLEFSNLANLQVLQLQYNDLSGNVPDELCQLRDENIGNLLQFEIDCKDDEVVCPATCCTNCGQ